jgi:alkyl hydroperoxide reductase subunit F
MFDNEILDQLRGVFKSLSQEIVLQAKTSQHEKQAELVEFIGAVAATSDKIRSETSAEVSEVPEFAVLAGSIPTGMRFVGIPGGHEFTSLILAILNADNQGKMPDDGLKRRISRIKSGIEIRTFVSLSCENCPDVVQALNQIAIVHGGIKHSTIDGAMVQAELDRLKIQGVPAVFVGDEMIHSGRSNLAELISKLEEKYGTKELSNEVADLGHFDVAVIGGGPAGASAAIYSVRKGLKTVLIAEKIGGQMQETKGIENFASVKYTEGPALSSNLDQHLRSYPIQVLENRRVSTISEGAKRTIELIGGERLTTDAVIVATGAKWRELGVPGEKEYIGRGVAFCPHCDGPYYKGKSVAVVGGGNSGVEAAIDLSGICSSVVVFEFNSDLKADKVLVDKLRSISNISVITNARTTQILGNGEKVIGLEYENRVKGELSKIELDGVFVQIGLSPNSGFVSNLVEVNKFGEIIVDVKGRTTAQGVYAAGDVTTVPFKQIMIAMGEGAKVALTAFEDRMRAS